MGMFDWVEVEQPLPDGWTAKGGLQTKDFDCEMTTIKITADGRLMREHREFEEVPLAERPDPSLPFLGSIRVKSRAWRDLDYHGDFNFYGTQENSGGHFIWHEYLARFTDGKLAWIKPQPQGQ